MRSKYIALLIILIAFFLNLLLGCSQEDIVKEQDLIAAQIHIQAAPAATLQHDITDVWLVVLQNGQAIVKEPFPPPVNRRTELRNIPLAEGTYTFLIELFDADSTLIFYKQEEIPISVDNRTVTLKAEPLRLTIGEKSELNEYALWLQRDNKFAVSVQVGNIQSLSGATAELEFDPPHLLEAIDVEAGDLLGKDILFLGVTSSEFKSIPEVSGLESISPSNQSRISIGMTQRGPKSAASVSGTLATIIFKPIANGDTTVRFAGDTLLKLADGTRIERNRLVLGEARYSITIED